MSRYEVNALGKQCPVPVVMTKKVIDHAAVGDEIEILVDNETAVKNLSRLAVLYCESCVSKCPEGLAGLPFCSRNS